MEKIYAMNELQAIICPILRDYGVRRAYLFGSYARGEATAQSDIDLRIDGGRIRSMFGLGALYHELTQALKKPVDLVTTEALSHDANAARTQEFREGTKDSVYRPAIKGMRNLFAHNYGAVDVGLVWETAVSDIPILHEFCNQTIRMFRFLEQGEERDGDMER